PVYYPSNPPKIIRPTYKPNGGGPTIIRPTYRPGSGGTFIRVRRSPDDDWIFRPDLGRDDRGNTRGTAAVEKHGEDYDFNAQYGQTFRGPDKHSETWHVGGSFRWSDQPIYYKMTCVSLLLFCGLFLCVTAIPEPEPVYYPNNPPRVIHPTYRPSEGGRIIHPTYRPGSGGQFIRVRRSPDDDWIFRPDLSRDNDGNTRGQATLEKHGDDYDINAQFGQTFRGPEKHSEAWHVGGTFRF
ncbi:acaloleptin A-like, partial [Rhynchophorus ferrugineus]|uniref:acaloleptin A-like n=1 Tax=Rhynchophorus ferrugineus TaxID=354439 RepID=UPI003FCCE75A